MWYDLAIWLRRLGALHLRQLNAVKKARADWPSSSSDGEFPSLSIALAWNSWPEAVRASIACGFGALKNDGKRNQLATSGVLPAAGEAGPGHGGRAGAAANAAIRATKPEYIDKPAIADGGGALPASGQAAQSRSSSDLPAGDYLAGQRHMRCVAQERQAGRLEGPAIEAVEQPSSYRAATARRATRIGAKAR